MPMRWRRSQYNQQSYHCSLTDVALELARKDYQQALLEEHQQAVSEANNTAPHVPTQPRVPSRPPLVRVNSVPIFGPDDGQCTPPEKIRRRDTTPVIEAPVSNDAEPAQPMTSDEKPTKKTKNKRLKRRKQQQQHEQEPKPAETPDQDMQDQPDQTDPDHVEQEPALAHDANAVPNATADQPAATEHSQPKVKRTACKASAKPGSNTSDQQPQAKAEVRRASTTEQLEQAKQDNLHRANTDTQQTPRGDQLEQFQLEEAIDRSVQDAASLLRENKLLGECVKAEPEESEPAQMGALPHDLLGPSRSTTPQQAAAGNGSSPAAAPPGGSGCTPGEWGRTQKEDSKGKNCGWESCPCSLYEIQQEFWAILDINIWTRVWNPKVQHLQNYGSELKQIQGQLYAVTNLESQFHLKLPNYCSWLLLMDSNKTICMHTRQLLWVTLGWLLLGYPQLFNMSWSIWFFDSVNINDGPSLKITTFGHASWIPMCFIFKWVVGNVTL